MLPGQGCCRQSVPVLCSRARSPHPAPVLHRTPAGAATQPPGLRTAADDRTAACSTPRTGWPLPVRRRQRNVGCRRQSVADCCAGLAHPDHAVCLHCWADRLGSSPERSLCSSINLCPRFPPPFTSPPTPAPPLARPHLRIHLPLQLHRSLSQRFQELGGAAAQAGKGVGQGCGDTGAGEGRGRGRVCGVGDRWMEAGQCFKRTRSTL
jgi:hypothetical protein